MRRWWIGPVFIVAMCSGAVFMVGQETPIIHENTFSSKLPVFIKGEENVKAEEKAHTISNERARSLPTSEYIKLSIPPGRNDNNYIYYYYPTPPAPVTEELSAEVWVHGTRSGINLLARVVFPKERDPKQIDEPLTTLIPLDSSKPPAGGWQKLTLRRPMELLKAHQQELRLKYRKDIDITDAYVDRLVLNLYAAPGELEVYIDNLKIGPVKPGAKAPIPVDPRPPAKEVGAVRGERGLPVSITGSRLRIAGTEIFPRFIRYSGTPLQVLKEVGLNSLWMGTDIPIETINDAIDNYQFWIIPHLPPISAGKGKGLNPQEARDVDVVAEQVRKYQAADAVLFWDLGPVTAEDLDRVTRTVEIIQSRDANRPIGADVWDGFRALSSPIKLIGAHRDPLFTSMEPTRYSEWLRQRRNLASLSQFHWTWIQTHMPDWQLRLLYDKTANDRFTEPVGPQPEQIRMLTYIALANGCNGLGFWSDRFLADATTGRSRLFELALLNQEMEMLEPLLLKVSSAPNWVETSNPNVRAAIIKTEGGGLLVFPVWLGGGAQFVPPQAAVGGLTIKVPLPPDSAEPWEITPVRVQSLQPASKRVSGGMEITLPEFDIANAIVFTSDIKLVGRWQKHVARIGRFAAQWACDLAEEQYRQVKSTHEKIMNVAPSRPDDDQVFGDLLLDSLRRINTAKRYRNGANDEAAYFEAQRALRPLRVLMRLHWERAVKSLDAPTSSPYAVSYHTLPKHWELARRIYKGKWGADNLSGGDFENVRPSTAKSASVTELRGWTVQDVTLDNMNLNAAIVPASPYQDPEPAPPEIPKGTYQPTSENRRVIEVPKPRPKLGDSILLLQVKPKPVVLPEGKKPPPEPQALERTFLAVNSPPVRMTPGTWVRVSGWVKIPTALRATADGFLLYDTAGGEGTSLRFFESMGWKQIRYYRQIPASGEIRIRFALTGIGEVLLDDFKVEPLE